MRVVMLLAILLLETSSLLGVSGPAQAATPMLAGGNAHSCALASSGLLRCWGNDSFGQLGQGRHLSSLAALRVGGGFQTVPSKPGLTGLAGGYAHTLALKSDGSLWSWGRNDYGQLGDGTTTDRSTPKQIGTGYSAVAAGSNHSVALKSDGSLWAWGHNGFGELGDGSLTHRSTPQQIGTGYVALAAGSGHTVAIDSAGFLWAWGKNDNGQLGSNMPIEYAYRPVLVGGNYTAVAAGMLHTVALKGGSLYAWGANERGQLGDGTTEDKSSPKLIGTGYSAVAAGSWHTVALKRDSSLWAWGLNQYGQLGDGTKVNKSAPMQIGTGYGAVSAGFGHTVALANDSSLWAWGSNGDGQLGDETRIDSLTPKSIGKDFSAVASGSSFTLAIKNDTSLWAWGDNGAGQLGNGGIIALDFPTAKEIGTGYKALSANSEGDYTLAITADDSLWAWGNNGSGQLGDGTQVNRSSPFEVGIGYRTVSAGWGHVVAVRVDGSLWAWGSNLSGQLGDGSQGGARLVPKQVQAGTGYKSAAAGRSHTLALKTDGALWAWGSNEQGQLGDGTTTDRPAPVQIGSGFSAVAAGSLHSVALKNDGSLWAWGRNLSGQIGDGTAENKLSPTQIGTGFSAVSAGNFFTVALKSDGSVWSWGENIAGQLGDGTTTYSLIPKFVGNAFSAVTAGGRHTIALALDGSLWASGNNASGQLGDGTLSQRSKPVRIVNEGAFGFLSLTGAGFDTSVDPLTLMQIVGKTNSDLSTRLTDLRASGFSGEVYFSALLPRSSPLVRLMKSGHKSSDPGMIPVTFTRSGAKQTGPTVVADSNYSGPISTSSQYSIYGNADSDPLTNSNAVICMGLTVPILSAKGQLVMRAIATGDNVQGVVQCPTVQTEATIQKYKGQTDGPLTSRSITATITPQPDEIGQTMNLYSWAIAPDGTQFMQTGPNQWALMAEPMQPAATVKVSATGTITLPVTRNIDLSSIPGTLIYLGMGPTWELVRDLNMAGHYYTVQ